MILKRVYIPLVLVMSTNLYSENNPLPSDEQVHQKMAQEIKKQMHEEASKTKSIQAERIADFLEEDSPVPSTLEAQASKALVQTKKLAPKVNSILKKLEISLPENEKDRYAVPTF